MYQKKHNISANASGSSSPSRSKVQSGVRKTQQVGRRSPTNIPGSSTTPIGDKKRRREVDLEDTNLDSGVAKKMGRETASVHGSQPCDYSTLTSSPSAELQNTGKAREDFSPLICPDEGKAAAVGPEDHTSALSGSGDGDQEVETQSGGRENDSSAYNPFRVPLVNSEARRWTLAGDGNIPRVDTPRDDRRASVQHIDLRALHSSRSVGLSQTRRAISVGRSSTSETSNVAKKRRRKPFRPSTPPNLSESNKELVLALGLDVVYSRMAQNHKLHVDLVREVATKQQSLEDADRVLCNIREAAGQARARGLALKGTTASPDSSPIRSPDYSPPTPTRAHAFLRLGLEGRLEEAKFREARRVRCSLWPDSEKASSEADVNDDSPPFPDIQAIGLRELRMDSLGTDDGVIAANKHQTPQTEEIRHNGFPLERECATSSLACSALASLSVMDAEWSNSDDEVLLDGDMIAHEELLRRKGLSSVKLRTAHLYCLLLDG